LRSKRAKFSFTAGLLYPDFTPLAFFPRLTFFIYRNNYASSNFLEYQIFFCVTTNAEMAIYLLAEYRKEKVVSPVFELKIIGNEAAHFR